jgi:hypothetical protein
MEATINSELQHASFKFKVHWQSLSLPTVCRSTTSEQRGKSFQVASKQACYSSLAVCQCSTYRTAFA